MKRGQRTYFYEPKPASFYEESLYEQPQQTTDPGDDELMTGTVIKLYAKGVEVGILQEFLKIKVDYDFGGNTLRAVKAWQSQNGLTPTGIVDEQTLQKMKLHAVTDEDRRKYQDYISDVKLNFAASAKEYLVPESSRNILKQFLRDAGLQSASISRTQSTPEDQARIMLQKLNMGQPDKYAAPGTAVQAVYYRLKKQKASDTEILQEMIKEVYRQGPSKVSNHCGDPKIMTTVDISVSSIPLDKRDKFIAVVEAARARKIVKGFRHPGNDANEKAFHIEIPIRDIAGEQPASAASAAATDSHDNEVASSNSVANPAPAPAQAPPLPDDGIMIGKKEDFPAYATKGTLAIDMETGVIYQFVGYWHIPNRDVVKPQMTYGQAPPGNVANRKAGDFFFDRTTGILYRYDGNEWKIAKSNIHLFPVEKPFDVTQHAKLPINAAQQGQAPASGAAQSGTSKPASSTTAPTTTTPVPASRTNPEVFLKKGSLGTDVRALQKFLHIKVDGDFGNDTETALRNWQKANGLDPTGILDKATWNRMVPPNNTTTGADVLRGSGNPNDNKTPGAPGRFYLDESGSTRALYEYKDGAWQIYVPTIKKPAPSTPAGQTKTNPPVQKPAQTTTTPVQKPAQGGTVLRNGSKGMPVSVLQTFLKVGADGDFGDITEKAVKAWQKAHGLTPTGMVDKATWDKMVPPGNVFTGSNVVRGYGNPTYNVLLQKSPGKLYIDESGFTPVVYEYTMGGWKIYNSAGNSGAKPAGTGLGAGTKPSAGRTTTPTTSKPMLQKGSSGTEVNVLQTFLGTGVDGDFGNNTEKALINWQKAHGYPTTGTVDRATWDKMVPPNNVFTGAKVIRGKGDPNSGMLSLMIQGSPGRLYIDESGPKPVIYEFVNGKWQLYKPKSTSKTYSGPTVKTSGTTKDAPVDVTSQKWKDKVIEGSTFPDKAYNYNVKIKFNSAMTEEYLPAMKKVFPNGPRGFQLLVTIMANKEGFAKGTKSYRTHNPGNIGNTDSGATKSLNTLEDGIRRQKEYIENIVSGKSKAYPMGKQVYIKPFYSEEIAKNAKNYQMSPWLPGYRFTFTGQLDQFVKIYSTGARAGNSYLNMIISYFKANGIDITPETKIQDIIKMQ